MAIDQRDAPGIPETRAGLLPSWQALVKSIFFERRGTHRGRINGAQEATVITILNALGDLTQEVPEEEAATLRQKGVDFLQTEFGEYAPTITKRKKPPVQTIKEQILAKISADVGPDIYQEMENFVDMKVQATLIEAQEEPDPEEVATAVEAQIDKIQKGVNGKIYVNAIVELTNRLEEEGKFEELLEALETLLLIQEKQLTDTTKEENQPLWDTHTHRVRITTRRMANIRLIIDIKDPSDHDREEAFSKFRPRGIIFIGDRLISQGHLELAARLYELSKTAPHLAEDSNIEQAIEALGSTQAIPLKDALSAKMHAHLGEKTFRRLRYFITKRIEIALIAAKASKEKPNADEVLETLKSEIATVENGVDGEIRQAELLEQAKQLEKAEKFEDLLKTLETLLLIQAKQLDDTYSGPHDTPRGQVEKNIRTTTRRIKGTHLLIEVSKAEDQIDPKVFSGLQHTDIMFIGEKLAKHGHRELALKLYQFANRSMTKTGSDKDIQAAIRNLSPQPKTAPERRKGFSRPDIEPKRPTTVAATPTTSAIPAQPAPEPEQPRTEQYTSGLGTIRSLFEEGQFAKAAMYAKELLGTAQESRTLPEDNPERATRKEVGQIRTQFLNMALVANIEANESIDIQFIADSFQPSQMKVLADRLIARGHKEEAIGVLELLCNHPKNSDIKQTKRELDALRNPQTPAVAATASDTTNPKKQGQEGRKPSRKAARIERKRAARKARLSEINDPSPFPEINLLPTQPVATTGPEAKNPLDTYIHQFLTFAEQIQTQSQSWAEVDKNGKPISKRKRERTGKNHSAHTQAKNKPQQNQKTTYRIIPETESLQLQHTLDNLNQNQKTLQALVVQYTVQAGNEGIRSALKNLERGIADKRIRIDQLNSLVTMLEQAISTN